MNKFSNYVVVLCAEFGDGYKPLTRTAFWKLYYKYGNSMEGLINSDENEVNKLLKRMDKINNLIDELSKKEIAITTFLDEDFPYRLYDILGDFCPPIFYKCGNSELNKLKFIGYTGSRCINENDELWTKRTVIKNIEDNYAIVTGGAKGIDTIALNTCIENSGKAVLFLPENILSKIQEPFIKKNINNNKILAYSHVSPFALKTQNSFAASALERNKYIYAMSTAAIAVKANINQGGTWDGAVNAIKHKWTHVYTWGNKDYAGNQALIQLGALPLTDEHDMQKKVRSVSYNDLQYSMKNKQLSVFDFNIT